MKYYIPDQKLDSQLTEIRQKIRLSMNGIVSEQMTFKGINYKKNFGVNIPRIKEIAKNYFTNHDLAQRLWELEIRETMILATLLMPTQELSIENALKWTDHINNIELVEQSCMNLFCKLQNANILCLKCVQSPNIWQKITGFVLAARISRELTSSEIHTILEMSIQISETVNFHLYKAVALCLSRLCRKDKDMAMYILNEIQEFEQSTIIGQQFIMAEVKQEILFLDTL
jgi:3-methyladenine DNA glycosylase AlkD